MTDNEKTRALEHFAALLAEADRHAARAATALEREDLRLAGWCAEDLASVAQAFADRARSFLEVCNDGSKAGDHDVR